jgi:hypothetical protein
VTREPGASCDVSGTFNCTISVGDAFVGQFTVDDSVLIGDGIKNGIPISNFFLKIGRVAWDQNGLDPDDVFSGFRDSNGLPDTLPGSPAFVVSGGALVDLVGGVFGGADIPFVDFSSPIDGPSNRFGALDFGPTALTGCLTIGSQASQCVTEPSTVMLAMLGPVLLYPAWRRARPRLGFEKKM